MAQDLKIMNVDYQINRPVKKILNIKNHIENENQINDSITNFLTTELISTKDNNLPIAELFHPRRVNPDLKQIPEKLYRIIDIAKEKNESIIFKPIKQNNPIIKDINQPLIYIDEIDKIPHEISRRPKKLLDKINNTDKMRDSNDIKLINENYEFIIDIKKKKNIPDIINKYEPNLSLIKFDSDVYKEIKKLRNKEKYIIIEDTNENISPLINEEISFNEEFPNNPIKRNIINPSIKEDEMNNLPMQKLKIKKDKINIYDKFDTSSDNINLKNANFSLSENTKTNYIPKLNSYISNLNPIQIDLIPKKYKYQEKLNEIKSLKINKDYIIDKSHHFNDNLKIKIK